MSAQMLASCREVKNLLPLFFDSELDARQMRAVALHSAKCPECEHQLRALERLQEIVAESINEGVDEIDLPALWPHVEQRLGPARASALGRLRLWWDERPHPQGLAGPLAVGAVAAGMALVLTAIWPSEPAPQLAPALPAVTERAVSIDSIDAATNVALLSEADTMVLWLDDEFAPMPVNVGMEDLP